jgi:hypothetical protein
MCIVATRLTPPDSGPRLRNHAYDTRVLVCDLALDQPGDNLEGRSSECADISGLASARARWAATRLSHIDAADAKKICRDYAISLHEAVTVRRRASICESSTDRRQLDLVLLDSEIDAFNNLIAEHCGS